MEQKDPLQQEAINILAELAKDHIRSNLFLQPKDFRDKLGLGSDKESLNMFREVMSILNRDKIAKWNPYQLSWEYLKPEV